MPTTRTGDVSSPLFHLGRTVATPGAIDLATRAGLTLASLLDRHHDGDWGNLCDDDRLANETALLHGDRLLSRYNVDGGAFYVITEADRSSTTVLLPSEY